MAVYVCTKALSIILSRPLENVLQYKARLKVTKLQNKDSLLRFILCHLLHLGRATCYHIYTAQALAISNCDCIGCQSKVVTLLFCAVTLSGECSEITSKPLLFCWDYAYLVDMLKTKKTLVTQICNSMNHHQLNV